MCDGMSHAEQTRESRMKTLSLAVVISAIGLALAAASPAEAAKKQKHKRHAGFQAHAMTPGGTTAPYQAGVMAGPLYNGQDYLGTDPDPNIRSYLLRDLNSRYGGDR